MISFGGYAYAIGEVRSCLAAHADGSVGAEQSARFERVLLDFDEVVGDFMPGISVLDGTDPLGLVLRLEVAMEELVELGFDALTAELLLDSAHGAGDAPAPSGHSGDRDPA